MKYPAAWAAAAFASLCVVAAGMSSWVQAHQRTTPDANSLALNAIPAEFGQWSEVRNDDGAVSPSLQDEHGRPIAVYDRIVSRTYVEPGHPPVMLMIAYKRQQYQEDRVHRPELCYYSQGFVVTQPAKHELQIDHHTISEASFVAEAPQRRETVLYFIRIGSALTESSTAERLALFKAGLSNTIPDGILVRASVVEDPSSPQNARAQLALMQNFLSALIYASPSAAKAVLIGGAA
jgi:EpsI family protein